MHCRQYGTQWLEKPVPSKSVDRMNSRKSEKLGMSSGFGWIVTVFGDFTVFEFFVPLVRFNGEFRTEPELQKEFAISELLLFWWLLRST